MKQRLRLASLQCIINDWLNKMQPPKKKKKNWLDSSYLSLVWNIYTKSSAWLEFSKKGAKCAFKGNFATTIFVFNEPNLGSSLSVCHMKESTVTHCSASSAPAAELRQEERYRWEGKAPQTICSFYP